MYLVLVESPTKARKLSSYLGNEYVVRASVGHIRDLPKSTLGVDVDKNFQPEYVVPPEKSKVVKELKSLATKSDKIFLATDPDREGEAIAWHLQEILGSNYHYFRSTFHEITKQAVMEAIDNPIKLNLALVDAQQARRVLDRLVGYTVSPVLWRKVRSGLSAGRVQSVALRLIVEREKEILAFVPEEYWEVDVLLATESVQGVLSQKSQVPPLSPRQKTEPKYFVNNKMEVVPEGMLLARIVEVAGKKYLPVTQADVTPILSNLNLANYRVQSVERKERSRVSLPPLTTSMMQQQSANRYGYTSKSTMRLAQQLYEEGLITYHRTDSVNLSSQAVSMAREFIGQKYGPSYVPEKPRYFSTKTKNAQEAHEAIRPTNILVFPGKIASDSAFSPQHAKLYELIWSRFVASQMSAAVYDQSAVLIEATLDSATNTSTSAAPANKKGGKDSTLILKSTGSLLKFDGWMKLFPNHEDTYLPEVEANDKLGFVEENAAQKFTAPPARYNDGSLIKTLEAAGIGRPSTYASIISVLEDRGYVERVEKKFVPTAIGTTVCEFLVSHFVTLMDYKFTAKLEDDLDAVSRGEKDWKKLMSEFYTPFNLIVSEVMEKAERASIPVEKTGDICPVCNKESGGEIVIRTGKYGKFLSCSRYPDCIYKQAIVKKLEGVLCPLCQLQEVIIKPSRYGKDFYGCGRYPECNWASWKKPGVGERVTPEEWAIIQKEREERKVAREAKYGKSAKFGRFGKLIKSGADKAATSAKKVAKKSITTKKSSKGKVDSKKVANSKVGTTDPTQIKEVVKKKNVSKTAETTKVKSSAKKSKKAVV